MQIEMADAMDKLRSFYLMVVYSSERTKMRLIIMERGGTYKKMAHIMNMISLMEKRRRNQSRRTSSYFLERFLIL